jgi:hypothetical protein
MTAHSSEFITFNTLEKQLCGYRKSIRLAAPAIGCVFGINKLGGFFAGVKNFRFCGTRPPRHGDMAWSIVTNPTQRRTQLRRLSCRGGHSRSANTHTLANRHSFKRFRGNRGALTSQVPTPPAVESPQQPMTAHSSKFITFYTLEKTVLRVPQIDPACGTRNGLYSWNQQVGRLFCVVKIFRFSGTRRLGIVIQLSPL